jgi:hypothetical protein
MLISKIVTVKQDCGEFHTILTGAAVSARRLTAQAHQKANLFHTPACYCLDVTASCEKKYAMAAGWPILS